MFELSAFGETIFKNRYSQNKTEPWEESVGRSSRIVAATEDNGKIKTYTDAFYEVIINGLFMPGGRILYGSGRPKAQLLNCNVVPTADSREGWGQTASDVLVISGTGGGVGMNFSPVRPRGSIIHGHEGTATGSVSLMDIVNKIGEVIRAGGGRRAALMMALNHDHPDIPEFISKKLDLDELKNANVSIVFMNESPEAFLRKVEKDELHELIWNGQVISTIPARELWKKILDNAVKVGEPGILNGHLANAMNNLAYYQPLVSTNPCGEIWLEPYGCCDLGSLVLPRFITKNGTLNKRLLAQTINTAVRFLDNVLEVNYYPLKAIEENAKTTRRIGLGVMGLHDMLIKMGMKYTSDQAMEFVDSLFSFIKKKAYEASIFLAAEKGQFPALDRAKFVESGFCKNSLSEGMRERIMQHGIRNCALITIAPTGTTSIVQGVSSGIEPIPAAVYRRNYLQGDETVTEIIEHPLFSELKQTEAVNLFENASDIPPEKHLRMQEVCQAHVDNSISKTINLPRNYTSESLDPILRRFISNLKGVTLYREGSRGESPIQPLDIEEALAIECPSGACDL